MIFSIHPNSCHVHPQPDQHTAHFNCLSPFLPATHHVLSPRDFNARRFPRGRLVRCSPHSLTQLQLESFLTQLQLESFPRLPLLFFKTMSCETQLLFCVSDGCKQNNR
jgi:hypothetical protein